MKISIAASILILAVAASLAWRGQQQLAVARASHAALVAKAAQLGISLNSSNAANPVRITKRGRENKEADAKLAAAEFLAFAKEMEGIHPKGGPADEAQQKRSMEIMDRMMSLDSTQLQIVIAEFRAAKDITDELRQAFIQFSIMMLSSNHPQAALALLTESSDLLKDGNMSKQIVISSLGKWAKDDPLGALEWVKKNTEKFPDLVTDDAKCRLITGVAVSDSKLAFKLIGELGIKQAEYSVDAIVSEARTPEEKTKVLAALREYLATVTNEETRQETKIRGLASLASGISEDGFEPASKWLATAKLTPDETETFISGLNFTASGENGKWIEWIGASLPADSSDEHINRIVHNWTENDFQAAGKWLSTTAEGPAKNAAIRSYAETVARYEPETAAQWAMTLPPGQYREQTLQRIYQKLPKQDPAAKAALRAAAEEIKTAHGIK